MEHRILIDQNGAETWESNGRRTLKNVSDKHGFLLGLFFDPEDVGDMLLRNVG
jgi:hypothetical protein